jgi:hypothetical protein
MPTISPSPIRPVRLLPGSPLTAVACVLAALLFGGGCGDRAEAKESAAVRAAFEAYRTALLARDGEAASALVDRETIEHFDRMVDHARRAPAAIVRQQSRFTQVLILSLRHRVPREVVLDATGEEVFRRGIEEGWIGTELARMELGTIAAYGDVATAEILVAGKKTGVHYTFRREANAWKLALVPAMALVDQSLGDILRKIGPDEETAMLTVLERVSGTKVPPTIWQPMAP